MLATGTLGHNARIVPNLRSDHVEDRKVLDKTLCSLRLEETVRGTRRYLEQAAGVSRD